MTEQQTIQQLIKKARLACAAIESYSQTDIDEITLAMAWAIMEPSANERLANMAVETTGIGHVPSKIKKNYRKTLGLLRDLKHAKTVGIINEQPEKGLIEIARPVGVVCAVVPSTNPIATPLNKAINSIKCKNAVILAPSPKGDTVCTEVVSLIHKALERIGAPKDLVQKLPSPISKEMTNELTRQADLVVATGSQNNILRALQSGTPTLGVGVGNVPSIIDTSVNLNKAAELIHASKTFDYATSCSSENSLIIVDEVYQAMLDALGKKGAVLLSDDEKQTLQHVMWDARGIMNRDIVAQSAKTIAEVVGLSIEKFQSADILMVEESGIGADYPFSKEKLSPVLTVYRATDFDDALLIAKKLLTNQGQGHSVGIHSKDDAHIQAIAEQLPVCRVIVNQAHCFAVGGNFDNGMPFSLSMGCGTWGGNVIGDNLNYKNYMNITKIVRTILPNMPSDEEIFSDYWQKYDCK